jgi:hypothetical protein
MQLWLDLCKISIYELDHNPPIIISILLMVKTNHNERDNRFFFIINLLCFNLSIASKSASIYRNIRRFKQILHLLRFLNMQSFHFRIGICIRFSCFAYM